MTAIAGLAVPATEDEERIPGDVHMWVFVLGDLVIFGVYFVVFMAYRVKQHAAFVLAQHDLNVTTGALNTLVLLTSSWFVAGGVRAVTGDHPARAARLIRAGAGCGALFVAIKIAEWSVEVHDGHTLGKGTFLACYFMFTGVHLLHVIIGLIILGVALRELRQPDPRRWLTEACGIYWHMVDLLWVLIFVVLYVMR
ncbi:MAG TPA: cytochrome c oxidase subunit 3 [Mycobacteriales bacterium]|nr:cytochrome c oxidase subunit 3 [Mycobacteriales bacterium]